MTGPWPRAPRQEPAPTDESGVALDLAVAFVPTAVVGGATWLLLNLPASYLLVTVALYLAMAGVVAARAPGDLPGPGLGPANRVTLGRATLALPVAALCLPPVALGARGAWWVIGIATVVMILDGVDGRVARRTGTGTAFGARFDMELDAALIMALSVLVWASGRAGPWVLLMGLMRYGFVAAAVLWPALGAELPESFRRKVVCVVQGVVLLVALGPIIPARMATAVLAAGLASLVYSFAVDIRWLLRAAPR